MQIFKTVFSMKVSDTLSILKELKSPVPRTCHIGNNTSNNWAFLKLVNNAYLLQYDHTAYGVDEVCSPWLVLKDKGVIKECFSVFGEKQTEFVNVDFNNYQITKDNLKYSQYLNYSIPAIYNKKPLFSYFYQIASELSFSLNRSIPSFDSKQLLSLKETLDQILTQASNTNLLHLFFDRWASTTKKGIVVMEKIKQVAYVSSSEIEITLVNNRKIFRGDIKKLLEIFFNSLAIVSSHIIDGKPIIEKLSYPWTTLAFSYLVSCISDFLKDPYQTDFWHGAGSSSQYYINNQEFSKKVQTLTKVLVKMGYLPYKSTVNFIPTFNCQLFATGHSSQIILEDMIDRWLTYGKKNNGFFEEIIRSLSISEHPKKVIELFFKSLKKEILVDLQILLNRFNDCDANTLPIAHISKPIDPMYTRYGISQNSLKKKPILFPRSFYDTSWGNLELLTKVLAELRVQSY